MRVIISFTPPRLFSVKATYMLHIHRGQSINVTRMLRNRGHPYCFLEWTWPDGVHWEVRFISDKATPQILKDGKLSAKGSLRWSWHLNGGLFLNLQRAPCCQCSRYWAGVEPIFAVQITKGLHCQEKQADVTMTES